VAKQLHLPLDVIVARKIGVPWQPELAMGAIAGTTRILNQPMIAQLGISDAEIDRVVSREELEMNRREELYRGDNPALNLKGKTAILIDDGLATGSTMLAAVRYARNLKAARIIIGVPVGSANACAHLRKEADDLICLATPPEFMAVGESYRDFNQVNDREVQNLLAQSHRRLTMPVAEHRAA
jgi:putative phosphoribosyl transferase